METSRGNEIMDDITLEIRTETLSDGSKVYNVHMTNTEQRIVLHAVTARNAEQLYSKILDAIDLHTVDVATAF